MIEAVIAYLVARVSVSAYAMHCALKQRLSHIPRWAFVVTILVWPYTLWLWWRMGR